MTQAYRNDKGLTFVFHEGVRLQGHISLFDSNGGACGVAPIDLSADQSGIATVADRISLSADSKTVTVPLANQQYPALAISSCFLDNAPPNSTETVYGEDRKSAGEGKER